MDEAYVLCDEIAIMDHGKIIAQGTPKKLLETHFNDVVLQIPEEVLANGENFPYQINRHKGVAEIATSDINQVIRDLIDRNVSLSDLQVRSRNLDDLFLELTGKEIRA
jgi:ABC-2 type transport system ATP-binding protein